LFLFNGDPERIDHDDDAKVSNFEDKRQPELAKRPSKLVCL